MFEVRIRKFYFEKCVFNNLSCLKILDTAKIAKVAETFSVSGKQSGWQRIAWAFLKVSYYVRIKTEE
jgi:hypothetical protein